MAQVDTQSGVINRRLAFLEFDGELAVRGLLFE